ncbi:MAG: efflux RND transporter periplasmic adaptor subunit, partial [Granulosicoccus sp.]|nr:efflux RND transporter periplasmic adaptor subunit [Granulosicoccus sp.]
MSMEHRGCQCGLAIALLVIWTTASGAEESPAGFDCVINPSQMVDLGSPESGQLREMLVDRGDRVKAGQVVAALDSRIEASDLAIASLRAETYTEVQLRKAAFENDRQTEERLAALVTSKAASVHDRDKATADADLSAWRVLKAKDEMQFHALELSRARIALDRRNIRSSIDGVVAARLSDPGEHIDDQPVLRIVKLDPLYVEAILPMRLFGRIKAGMSARVVPEIAQGSSLEASVILVDPMGDAGSGTFGARLELSNPDESIP